MSKHDSLAEAFAIVEGAQDVAGVVSGLRDFLKIDHVVYYSSKPSYIRQTYPASWIKRYLEMGYVEVDPVLREGFKRTIPFEWRQLKFSSLAEPAFQSDALAHGIGPHGYAIPVSSLMAFETPSAGFALDCAPKQDGDIAGSALPRLESVTHVSGTKCHLCVGPLT